MSEETLHQLFAQAREEKPETSLHDALKWIGGGTIAMVLAIYAMKMKTLLFANPLLIVGSVVTAGGITAGTAVVLQASESPENKHAAAVGYTKNRQAAEEQTDTIHVEEIEQEQPASLTTGKVKRLDSVPALPFIQYARLGIPLAPVFPVGPARPVKPAVFCGANNYGNFSALSVSGCVHVVVSQGDACDVRLEGEEEALKRIVIRNTGGTLEISSRGMKREQDGMDVVVYVTAVNLTAIHADGATSLESTGELEFPDLDIDMEGASDLDFKLRSGVLEIQADGAANVNIALSNTSDLHVESAGAANVSLEGKASVLDLDNSGAATFDGHRLAVAKATADCSGASHSELNVTDNLDITVSGASHVKYKGSPVIGEQSVSGAAHLGRF